MSSVLITGASGFIGRALVRSMSANHDVVCLSRNDPELDLPWVEGTFAAPETLAQLDDRSIDTVVHLGAVTGGAAESDVIVVNCEGSRALMRYLMDRGCKKYVMASSIAAVGFQSRAFRPFELPIPDEHPCLDSVGYGLSKFLMEEVTKFYQRQDESLDVINLRLSSVGSDDHPPELKKVGPSPGEWALGGLTVMVLSDAIRAFTMAAEAMYRPGVRIMNATGPKAWAADPVAEILHAWWGDDVDVSHFEQSGREFDSVYNIERIRKEIGFVAERLPGT